MTTPCACLLRGLDPRDIDPCLILTDVIEHPPELDRRTLTLLGRDGARVTKTRLRALSVSARFELHEPDPARRRHLCRELARWAVPGGLLTLGDRPGQRLRVTCDAPPVTGSTLGWTQPVTVRFTAWEAPWWEDETAVTAASAAPAASGTLTLRPTGDLPTPLEATVRNASGAVLDAVTLSCGGQAMTLTGLGMAPGETLTLDHDDRALTRLVIRAADGVTRSALPLRTAESADEILLAPRQSSEIRYAAGGPVTASVTARGRWL